jgi:hypothetical protein
MIASLDSPIAAIAEAVVLKALTYEGLLYNIRQMIFVLRDGPILSYVIEGIMDRRVDFLSVGSG